MKDPGLQPERTAQAWSRTGWAACAVALVGVRLAAGGHRPGFGVFDLVTALLGASIVALCYLRAQHLKHRSSAAKPWLFAAIAAWLIGCTWLIFFGFAFSLNR